MRWSLAALVLAPGAVVALATGAGASQTTTLRTDHRCYDEHQSVLVSGAGYTPRSVVELLVDGQAYDYARADAAGSLRHFLAGRAPALAHGRITRAFTLTDHDQDGHAARAIFSVSRLQVTVRPRRARLGARVTFRAAGFAAHRSLYAHYVYRRRLRKTVRLARLRGACGTGRARARLLPIRRPRAGEWDVQYDARRSFSRATRPAVTAALRVSRPR